MSEKTLGILTVVALAFVALILTMILYFGVLDTGRDCVTIEPSGQTFCER